jgi:hypothetical protein
LNTRRLALVALPVLAALSLAIGGCATADSAAQPSDQGSGAAGQPSGAASAGASAASTALLASTRQLGREPYHYHFASGTLSGDGMADPAAKAAQSSLTGTQSGNAAKIDMIAVGTDFWFKLNLGTANQTLGITTDNWLHLDAARLGAGANLPADPTGGAASASGLLSGAGEVQRTDDRHFSGTIDLTKVTGVAGVDQELLTKAGAKASAVPFTAVLDDQGRLSDLRLDLSSARPGQVLEVSFSQYGTPVSVTKPDPAQVTEAPDTVYQLFHG